MKEKFASVECHPDKVTETLMTMHGEGYEFMAVTALAQGAVLLLFKLQAHVMASEIAASRSK